MLNPAIANPLKETLSADAQPLLDDFTSLISSAVSGLVSKLPAAAEGPAAIGASLLLQVAHIFAQGELNILLAHNSHMQGSASQPLPSIEAQPPQAG